MSESKKRESIRLIFEDLKRKNPYSKKLVFSNDIVKKVTGDVKFSNQFDATKFESYEKLPECLRENGFFIMHLGKGRHAFVKGNGYHNFESIKETKEWKTKKSLIGELGKSEASTMSELYNSKIIHDFLYGKTNVDIQVHTARRTRTSYDVIVSNEKLHADKQQIEIDGIFETDEVIAAVEVKNVGLKDFEIRQLFNILKYFEEKKLPPKYKLRIIFVVRARDKEKNIFRLYEYIFEDKEKLDSIKLVRNAQYNII
jgi:hypothetical protein